MKQKNRITAALLALVFGGIGVHRFYLGKIVSGIFYLLLCWTFIPAIIALIEFIILICIHRSLSWAWLVSSYRI